MILEKKVSLIQLFATIFISITALLIVAGIVTAIVVGTHFISKFW